MSNKGLCKKGQQHVKHGGPAKPNATRTPLLETLLVNVKRHRLVFAFFYGVPAPQPAHLGHHRLKPTFVIAQYLIGQDCRNVLSSNRCRQRKARHFF